MSKHGLVDKFVRQQCIGDILRRAAKRSPDKDAILCCDVRWTYAEFDRICNRVGHSLLERGIGKGDPVAILSRNSHAFAAMR